jgi:hypothetical protein
LPPIYETALNTLPPDLLATLTKKAIDASAEAYVTTSQ